MVDLEYRVVSLDPEYPITPSKFIIHKENDKTLGLYALAKDMRDFSVNHYAVADFYHLNYENVLGGGDFSISKQTLRVNDWSLAFGSLPVPVANKVGETLAENLRGTGNDIREIIVNMLPIFMNAANREIWRSLGFDVPEPDIR